jgi:hypothetical protein
MRRMGVYDDIKRAFQDLIAPELHEVRGELRRLNEKIDGAQSLLLEKINSLRVEMTSARRELISEIRRLDTRIDSVDRELHTAIDIRARLAALEARREP